MCASANRCWQAHQLSLITSTLIPPSTPPPPLPLSPASHLGLSPTHVCRQASLHVQRRLPFTAQHTHTSLLLQLEDVRWRAGTSFSFVNILFVYSSCNCVAQKVEMIYNSMKPRCCSDHVAPISCRFPVWLLCSFKCWYHIKGRKYCSDSGSWMHLTAGGEQLGEKGRRFDKETRLCGLTEKYT